MDVDSGTILSIRGFDSAPDRAIGGWSRRRKIPRLRIPALDLAPGKCHAVIGKSGAGKTVLNSLLMGFPVSGTASRPLLESMTWWNGAVRGSESDFVSQMTISRCWQRVRHAGALLYLPQILPDGRGYQMSVRQYLLQVLPALGRQCQAATLFDKTSFDSFPTELSSVLDNSVTQLSGGERRRVELWARLAVLKKLPHDRMALLILDEPTTGLDVPDERRYLTELRKELASLPNLAVVVTTHALYFIDDRTDGGHGKGEFLFDRVFLVHKEPGGGTPDCRVTPATSAEALCAAVSVRNPEKSVEDNMEEFVDGQAKLIGDDFTERIQRKYFPGVKT